jgi:hypothetical protein
VLTASTGVLRVVLGRADLFQDRLAVTVFGEALSHPVVHRTLEESGWHPGYRHDTAAWEAAMLADGYSVHAMGRQILSEIGGLRIKAPTLPESTFWSGTFLVDPVQAATGESDRIVIREQELERLLMPVGEWSGEYIVLASEPGELYAETTWAVVLLGSTPGEALTLIVTAHTKPVVISCAIEGRTEF